MSRRVYLHIGAPKTGTTYLQDRLALNAKSLAAHDVHFPTTSPLVSPGSSTSAAALDLLGQDWGGPPGHADGSWDALVRRVKKRTGTVVISHEILAPAAPDQVARAMRDLAGSEIHVVYTARDLGRQLPAAWQESIKQGRRWTYRRFLDRYREGPHLVRPRLRRAAGARHLGRRPAARARPRRDRAAAAAPDQHGDLLWQRMCEVLGIDPAWAPLDSDRSNRSLGIAETQVIRQLNRRMDRAARRESTYDGLIRDMLAQGELVKRRVRRGAAAAGAVRLGRGAGRALDRVDRGQRRARGRRRRRAAAGAARPRTSRSATPTRSAPSASSTPRSTRWPR